MQRPVIMFDHDGVLVDSFVVFTAVFAAACRAHDHPEIATPAQVVALFDDNVYESMAALGMERAVIGAIIDDTAAALAASPNLRPFPGVPDLLAGLSPRFEVVVITSNSGVVVRDFLARERLAGLVGDVLGVEVGASKVSKIATMIARHPGQSRYYYVGDTRGDMLEGAAAGATPLGAGWGWQGATALQEAGAAYVAATPAELLAFVLSGAVDDLTPTA
jgi:phosphoglycolate phosphatase